MALTFILALHAPASLALPLEYVAHNTGKRITPVQGPLRAFKHLHPLNIHQLDVKNAPAPSGISPR